MGFKDGDFILIEYTVRVKETGNIVDTTNEELAKKENIYESGRIYGPVLIVIGKGWINKVVEDALREMNVGEEKTIEVPPEKAFGQRDPSKVKTFSLREFRRRNINVKVGDVLDFGGVKGVVKSISGGRVVIDFNHPLAGKTLLYKVKVVAKLEDIKEKIKALAIRHLQIPGEELAVEYIPEEKKVVINIPTRYIAKKDIQYAKISLVTDILDMFKEDVEKVVFQEVFERKKPSEKTESEKQSSGEKEERKTSEASSEA